MGSIFLRHPNQSESYVVDFQSYWVTWCNCDSRLGSSQCYQPTASFDYSNDCFNRGHCLVWHWVYRNLYRAGSTNGAEEKGEGVEKPQLIWAFTLW